MNKWIDNNIVKNCFKCKIEFNLYIRKHHCRICGNIYCYKCSDNFINIYNKNNFFFMSNTSRVCKKCYEYYKNINKINNLIDIFLLLPITIKDYYTLLLVSKKYNKLGHYLINNFKKIQYYFTDHNYTKIEKNLLWNNREYLIGHNKWIIQLIKSNYDKDIKNIFKDKKIVSCKLLKCSKICVNEFKPEDSIICLYPYIENKEIIDYILTKLSYSNVNQLKSYLPYLVFLLKNNNEQNIKLTNYLIFLSSRNYFFCNYFFWELNTQNNNNIIYSKIINNLIKKIEDTSKEHLNNSYNFINNLIYLIHNSNSIENLNTIIKNHLKTNNYIYPISLGLNPNILIKDIITDNTNYKNSNSKPLVLSFLTNDNEIYKILYKKEDIRTDLLVLNIINIIDDILKEEENLDLYIIKYNVLPINETEGFIELVPNCKTLFDIDKEGFTLQNYIIEKNKNKPTNIWRNKFTKSCAFYCVISYLLGFGDRHLENIMVTDSGILFHIDYTYILGKDPKILFPEIRITQDMVDCMGGVESCYYKEFEKLCAIIYNCLRRHFNLFQVLLYMLYHYEPKIKLNYSKDYINKYIIHKFFPNEENKEAKIFIIKKMSKFVTKNYSDSFIDICHNYAKNNKIIDSYNSVLKYLNNS